MVSNDVAFEETEIEENLPHLFRFEVIQMLRAHLWHYQDDGTEVCKKEVEELIFRYSDLTDDFS